MPEGQGKTDVQLRTDALAVLAENRHGTYTVPAIGLYPYQWCWDTGPDRARLGVGGRVGPGVGRARQAVLGAVAVGHGAPHRVLGAERRLLPRARGLVHQPGTGDDRSHATAAAGERGGAPLHRRPRSGSRPGTDRPAVAAPRRVAGLDRTRPHRAAPRRRRRPPVGVGHGQLTGVGRAARGHPRDLERAPRPARRRHRLGQAAAVDEGVPPLPRHRRRAAQRGMEHRNPGGRQPVRGRGPRVHRDHGPRRCPISPPSPRPPGRTAATSRGSPPRRAPASPGCGTKRSAGTAPTTCARASRPGRPPRAGSPRCSAAPTTTTPGGWSRA